MSNKNSPKKPLKNYACYSGIAIQMLAIIGIGTFVGIKIDENYPNKHNIFTALLSLTSVVLSTFISIRRIIANSKED